jgi:predicted Zn-dependent protease
MTDTPGTDQSKADQLIERIGDMAEARVIIVRGPHALTRFANSFIHQNVAEDRAGVMLTVAKDGRTASANSSRTDEAGLAELAERALAAASVTPVDPYWPGLSPRAPLGADRAPDPATAASDPDHRARIVKDYIAAGPGLLGAGYCETECTTAVFANSAGQRCISTSSKATLDGIHQSPTSAGSSHQTSVSISDLDGAAAGAAAAGKARAGIDGIDLEPGRYEVVLESNAVSTLMVFLAVYGFNGRAAVEKRTPVQPGVAQFDPAISIVDDATDPAAIGLLFDGDGTPKRRTTMIERGVPAGFLYDRRTAQQAGAQTTGHAVPGSGGFGALATNMFMAPGDTSYADLVGSVDRGLLVTEFNYCRVLDPMTLGVTGLTRNGTFLIENGEISRPVTNLRFTQSFMQALQPGSVLGVESAARFGDSEFGPGFAHAPSLRLAEWNFTGGASG